MSASWLQSQSSRCLTLQRCSRHSRQALHASRAAERSVLYALSRSADGLDYYYPLRWQPDNIEQFLQLAAEGLQRIAGS
jgi:hypothetical protein